MKRPRVGTAVLTLTGLATSLALASWAAPVIVRCLWPQVAVDALWGRNFDSLVVKIGRNLPQGPSDPWGHPWREHSIASLHEVQILMQARDALVIEGGNGRALTVYSMGPDGVDQGGDGDDLYPRTKTPARVWVPAADCPSILGAFALIAAWWAAWLWPLRRTFARQLLGALILASLPAAFAGWAVHWALKTNGTRDLVPTSPIAVLPVWAVAVGSVAVVAFVLALALKLGTRDSQEPSDGVAPGK